MNDRAPRSELKLVVSDSEVPTATMPKVAATGEPVLPIHIGDVINGRYLIERELGVGGVGIVYAARNIELDEPVALKFLKPETMTDAGIVGRFAREAKAAVSIKSEHVATVYDVGTLKDGRPFLVMEYLVGKDLGALLEERGKLPVVEAVEYALQVCEALAVAHAKGIVHRDIKPENLMLSERAAGIRVVKVLDFGISKAALTGLMFGENLPLVTTSNLMGTPMYMSPEQVRCQDNVDSRCDIWSLGMTLYEMITSSPPFRAQTVPELCAAILEQTPDSLETHRRDIPAGLNEVLLKCLAKATDDRYQNVAELAVALLPYGPKRARINAERAVGVLTAAGMIATPLEVESVSAPASEEAIRIASIRMPSTARVPVFASEPAQALVLPASASKANTVLIALIGILALAALGVGAALMLKRSATAPASVGAPQGSATVAALKVEALPVAALPSAAPSQAAMPIEASAVTATAAKNAAAHPAPHFTWPPPAAVKKVPALPATSAPVMESATVKPKAKPVSSETDLGY
jgi:predicted Ser/Thr protein kinase